MIPHTVHNQKRLLHRVSRIRGQVNGVEKALKEKRDCGSVLLTLAACRGALNALMAEILEDHVRFHVVDAERPASPAQAKALTELIGLIESYLK